MESYTIKL